ncbi:MAG TPA: tRNA uracil 4-sulfurtransferase ThiI [Oscillospiraceae bacterium]|nr:tRNA uracil 4-sulfurtransferase ThiI [Oscillospiraceae bacterium]HXK77242.1 tRNA uracil 4-sulfurtransferase ThiI [Oscillospiraceae bacterium]
MKEIILLKCGEIALKGLNKSGFEDSLLSNCRRRIADLGEFAYKKSQSTLYIEPQSEDIDLDETVGRLQKIFGIVALTRAAAAEKNFPDLAETAKIYLADILTKCRTFKVEAKRSDKSFPMTSPEISRELGGVLLERFPHLKVDVNHPDIVVMVEIRERAAYIHGNQLPGAGGMPVGTSGKALLLLSGGIDSPVAGYMMAKRGLEVEALHFQSPPYTGERAWLKVETLAQQLCDYCGKIDLFSAAFTEIQEEIKRNCPEELFTVIMRRFMMRVALRLAEKEGCGALITGESLAQVASQTLPAIACTDAVCDIPVFRPLIGMDKQEIVEIAQRIGTFETSILPYEDCCTVFTPRHPRTRPTIEMIEEAERVLDIPALLERCTVTHTRLKYGV